MMPLADSGSGLSASIGQLPPVSGTAGTGNFGTNTINGFTNIQPALTDLVMLEVNRQIKHELEPIRDALQVLEDGVEQIRHWKLGLWSNGKGGPPGWLEIFAKEINGKVDSLQASVQEMKNNQLVTQSEKALETKREAQRQQSWTIRLSVGMFMLSALMLLSTLAKDFHWF